MGKLTIQDIAKILVEKNGLSKQDANKFSTEMFTIIQQHLEQDDQVKVKGLGTFKIIQVEARESVSVRTGERVMIDGHEKVSFLPDSVMKELVNRPFSQFETVVLNDGVKFEDLQDDATEEEQAKAVEEEPVKEYLVKEEPAEVVEQPKAEEPAAEQGEPADEKEEPADEKEEQPAVAPVLEFSEPEKPAVLEFAEEPEERPWWRWPLAVLVVLALMGASAYGGYYYAMHKVVPNIIPEKVEKEEVMPVSMSAPVDSAATLVDTIPAKPVEAPVEKPAEAPVEAPDAKPVEAPAEKVDPYAAKDDRVRLGAYRIVGTDKEVKVEPGQTFYSICRAHLGPDMECYVEVYNDLPRNPKVKAGQTLKIPKLEWKKKRKR